MAQMVEGLPCKPKVLVQFPLPAKKSQERVLLGYIFLVLFLKYSYC
jgi:hypothetical protein